MWGQFPQINPMHSLIFLLQKNNLSLLNNLFMVRTQLICMSSYAKNKLQMCSVTQHQCRRRKMCGKFSQILPVLTFSVTNNDLYWLNTPFMVRFQLMRMSFYFKDKLEMCSVTQEQRRCRQMWGNFSQTYPIHSLFFCYKTWLVLTEQSIYCNTSTH